MLICRVQEFLALEDRPLGFLVLGLWYSKAKHLWFEHEDVSTCDWSETSRFAPISNTVDSCADGHFTRTFNLHYPEVNVICLNCNVWSLAWESWWRRVKWGYRRPSIVQRLSKTEGHTLKKTAAFPPGSRLYAVHLTHKWRMQRVNRRTLPSVAGGPRRPVTSTTLVSSDSVQPYHGALVTI